MGTYRYNENCACEWCRNNGLVDAAHPDSGHAFGYGTEHNPPASARPANRVRIIALLSFYDETAEWLTRCIASLTHLPVDGLVALDGAYELYPDAQPSSPPEQRAAIRRAARAHSIPLLLETPEQPWPGEVEKRNHLFTIAETTAADWYFVIDADEYITSAPADVPGRLAASPFDVAAVELKEPGHPLGTIVYPTHPKFFRAISGLRAVQDHFTYTTPDGRRLWGDQKKHRLEARHDLTDVKVTHENQLRHPDRRENALTYYRTRDTLGVEELPDRRSLLTDQAA